MLKFTVKQVCAALIAGLGAFSATWYMVAHPVTLAGWTTIAIAVLPALLGGLYSDQKQGYGIKLF